MRGRLLLRSIYILILSSCPLTAQAAVVFVDGRAATCGDGQSWATAYKHLQDALTAARNSNGAITEIWVAAGTYTPDRDCTHPDGTLDRFATFALGDGIALRGGFAGNEDPATFNLTNRDFSAHQTVLSGVLGNTGAYHVVSVGVAGPATVLDGFTITGGNASGTWLNDRGGGIYIYNSGSPAIMNCTLRGNCASATVGGGGIYNSGGSPILTHCVFSGNSALMGGSGMYNAGGSPTLKNCLFAGQYCTNSSTGYGGGICNNSSTPTLINCEFRNNSAEQGGAIYNNASDATLINCSFIANSVNSNGAGGGIYNLTSSPVLINCTFAGNAKDNKAGGNAIHNSGSSPRLTNCILWGNGTTQMSDTSNSSAIVTYSCIQGGWTGTGNISSDPGLLANGHLRRGSPCIDAADTTALPPDISTDLPGNPRLLDDPDTADNGVLRSPSEPIADIGAFEYAHVPERRLYVSAVAEPGGDGHSWATALQFLQDALASLDPGVTEIWVSAGVYLPGYSAAHPTGTGSSTATFELMGRVAIYGGFPGQPGQEDLFASRDPSTYTTTLDGQLATTGGFGTKSAHVVSAYGVGPETLLDGVSISAGTDGVYLSAGSPTLHGCIISRNKHGINNLGGSPKLIYCTIRDNQGSAGAGMCNSGGSPELTHCTFIGNKTSGHGAGMLNTDSNPTITNCSFVGNTSGSSAYGAGIYNSNSSPLLINCVFTGNVISPGGYTGSALFVSGGSPRLVNCTMAGNTGSAIASAGATSTPTLANCIVYGNYGRSVTRYSGSGEVTIDHSCIQGGWAGTGNISADPRLVFVAGNDLRLRHNSPCIDAGNNSALSATTTSDMADRTRLIDDPDTPDTGNPGDASATVVDMGAYEYQPVAARRLYVNAASLPAGSGESWTAACRFLQDAMSQAATDPGVTEIWVAGGTYKPDRDEAHPLGTGDRTATFQLVDSIAMLGGFPGQPGQEDDLSVRNPAAYVSLLSGDLAENDGSTSANNGENSLHVLTATSLGTSTSVDGFTVSGGNPGLAQDGGALYCFNSGVAFRHCVFARHWGFGAIYNVGGAPAFLDCLLRECTFGFWNNTGTTTLTNCTVTACTSNALYPASGTIKLANCIVWGNGGASAAGSVTASYSCIQGGWSGTGNISDEPRLLSNGHLRIGSPCIDAGDNDALPIDINSDLAGTSRFIDDAATPDTGRAGTPPRPAVDMGAFEYEPVTPGPVYVDSRAAPGGNGHTWATAYRYLQDALTRFDMDPAVTEIWVASGTYQPDLDSTHPLGTGNRSASFCLRSGLSILGGFPGQAGQEGDRSSRNPNFSVTTLSGDLAGNDGLSLANNSENSYHVVTVSGTGSAAVLDGFTITGGNANASSPNHAGGAINCGGNPTFRQCVIKGNSALSLGGAMYSSGSNPMLINCIFTGNATGTSGYGGAMCIASGSPTLTNCSFAGNSARYGGAVYASNSTPTLHNCILWGNTATTAPPLYGSPTVTYSCVQGGYTGTGNISSDPLFVNAAAGDLRLSGTSPCIDAGNPASDYSLEPEPDGGRINMGAYGNTSEAETRSSLLIEGYKQVSRTRVGRTTFEYQFNLKMRNAATVAANNVVAQLLAVPTNVQVVQGVVNIPSIAAGDSATSTETFTIRVDRSTPVSVLPISWKVTSTAGTATLAARLDLNGPRPADFNNDGSVNDIDLMIFQACASGPAIAYDINSLSEDCTAQVSTEGILAADFDADHDVDQADFGVFQASLGTPE